MSALDDLIHRETAEVNFDRDFAVSTLSESAREGALLLFIGAGVSISTTPLGKKKPFFPTWSSFLNDLGKIAGVKRSRRNLFDWASAIEREYEESGRRREFAEAVENAIYKRFPGYNFLELNRELIFSLCSLIAKSRDRRPLFIVNLNYDDILEWSLCQFGYTVKIVTDFPAIVTAHDVVSIHPHGFLPRSSRFKSSRSEKIVLSSRSYRESIREMEWYHELLRVLIGQSVSLYVGLSGEDPHVLSLFEHVRSNHSIKRILGFKIGVGRAEDTPETDALKAAGVCSVSVQSHDLIPEFIYDTSFEI